MVSLTTTTDYSLPPRQYYVHLETLGMALLLLPDPVGLKGLSFSWMTGCGFDTITLGILCGGGGTGDGSAGSGSLGAWLLPWASLDL